MGRRPARHTDAGEHARRRGGDLSNAAGSLKAEQRRAEKDKRSQPTAIAGITRRFVVQAAGDAAAKRWDRAYRKALETGVTLDDVAAVLLARLVVLTEQIAKAEVDAKTSASQMGSINREIKDLAEAYREQGRALPDEVTFRWELVSAAQATGVVPAGEPPEDAPPIEHRDDVGDLLESE